MELQKFYKSSKWEKLLKSIKNDRLSEDGSTICEYCGKPIVKAYDCIGHHKIELTGDNVNDVSISLNPYNIALIHHKCHNKIHNKLGYSKRNVYIVWGSPLAGKSTFVKESMVEGDLVVDMIVYGSV